MSSINKVVILGYLGKEPEIRFTGDGKCIANITVATSSHWKDRNTGERQEKTEWHRLVAFGRNAEIIRDYLHKGSQCHFEGALQTRKWQDQQGQDRYTTEVVINEITLIGSRGSSGGQGEQSYPSQQQSGEQSPENMPANNFTGDNYNDDIPFEQEDK